MLIPDGNLAIVICISKHYPKLTYVLQIQNSFLNLLNKKSLLPMTNFCDYDFR
jgi:hypothetical protein